MARLRRFAFDFLVVGSSSAALLATLCGAAPARAESQTQRQPAPPPGSQGMLQVHVTTGERPFAVYFGRGTYPVAACARDCDFWAWPGTYRVRIEHGDGPNDDATLALRVRRPGSYAFVPANGNTQNAGLILGVAGPVLGIAGLTLTTIGLLGKTCNPRPAGQTCDRPASLYVGLGALAVSGVLTPIGWLLYDHHRAHFQFQDGAPATTGPRVSLVAMPQAGLGLGASWAF